MRMNMNNAESLLTVDYEAAGIFLKNSTIQHKEV